MTLQEIGLKTGTDKAHTHKYCDFYEKVLPKDPKRILEIGVKYGSSLRMWKEYFPDAEIIGIDIAEPIQVEGCVVLQIDQCDQFALSELGMFDLIIDDGSHMTLHQQISFNQLYYHNLNQGGLYIMEDLHTSFCPDYINSKYTTYELLQRFKNKIEWCRLTDKSDSLTVVIQK